MTTTTQTPDQVCGIVRQPDGSGQGLPCLSGGTVHLVANHPTPAPAGHVMAADDDNPYAYQLWTVSPRFHIVSTTTVYAPSADMAVARAIAMGYVKAEAAPAVPANGYPEGLPVRRGDTAKAVK